MTDAPTTRAGAGFRTWAPDALLIAIAMVALWGHALLGGAGGRFVLLRDAVGTPDPPLSDAALGVGPAAARAVPQDVTMWALQHAFAAVGLPEALVLPLLVAAGLALLGVAGRAWALAAVPGAGFAVRAPAIALAMWNPFVTERLAQGAWSLLLGVAAAALVPLYFLLTSDGRRRQGTLFPAWLVPLIALAAFTPTGLVMAAAAVVGAMVVAACAGRKIVAPASFAVPALALGALPTLAGTLLGWGAADAGSAEAGVAAFAARAEPGLATIGSLAGLGGIWNADAVPGSRSGGLTLPFTLPLLLVWIAGAALAFRRPRPDGDVPSGATADMLPARTALGAAAVVVVLVALAATSPGQATLTALIDAAPALGVLRDGQKWVGLAIPGAAVAIALVANAVRAGIAPASMRLAAAGAAAFVLVPLVLVPDAGKFLAREFTPVRYGDGWDRVNDELAAASEESGRRQTVLVLPAGGFRSTPQWADGRVVLDPAPRLLHAAVLEPGDLAVAGQLVEGEGADARDAQRALLQGTDAGELAAMGVDWVLDESTSRGERGVAADTLAGAQQAFADDELTLWRLPAADSATEPSDAFAPASDSARRLALAAHAAWALALVGGVACALIAGRRR